MAGFRRHIARHIRALTQHHKRHKGHFLKVFHAIRRHPGAYRPGFRPSRAAVPKSLPRKPNGLNKEAAGLWDWAKKGWSWVKSKFDQHKGKIYDHAKKHASAAASHVASRVGDAGKRMAGRVADKISAVADRNIEHYVDKAEGKIEALGKKAEAKISKWDKKKVDHMPGKSGSGIVANMTRNMLSRARSQLYRKRNPGAIYPASGVFSQRFKRRSRAAVQAFRRAR